MSDPKFIDPHQMSLIVERITNLIDERVTSLIARAKPSIMEDLGRIADAVRINTSLPFASNASYITVCLCFASAATADSHSPIYPLRLDATTALARVFCNLQSIEPVDVSHTYCINNTSTALQIRELYDTINDYLVLRQQLKLEFSNDIQTRLFEYERTAKLLAIPTLAAYKKLGSTLAHPTCTRSTPMDEKSALRRVLLSVLRDIIADSLRTIVYDVHLAYLPEYKQWLPRYCAQYPDTLLRTYNRSFRYSATIYGYTRTVLVNTVVPNIVSIYTKPYTKPYISSTLPSIDPDAITLIETVDSTFAIRLPSTYPGDANDIQARLQKADFKALHQHLSELNSLHTALTPEYIHEAAELIRPYPALAPIAADLEDFVLRGGIRPLPKYEALLLPLLFTSPKN